MKAAGLLVPLTLALACAASARAAEPLATQVPAFAEAEILPAIKSGKIPGAVFAVVARSGETVLWSAGLSDLETKTPMDAQKTVVRVASTSKLFTALAAADLWARGKLDLDADVNTVLGRPLVPKTFPEPVTTRELLTHSAGFDERYVGIVARDYNVSEGLEDFVGAELPARVRPPGQFTSYSNHAFALAGLVVEKAAGEPFAKHIARLIFEPLGMSSSSFELPEALRKWLATGYELRRGALRSVPLDRIRTMPASSLVTTAADMSRFLLLELDLGRAGEHGPVVVSEKAVRETQRRQFANAPGVAGFGLAFMEREVRGARVLLHGGEARGVNTLFAIVPAAGIGFFLNYNRFGSDVAEAMLVRFVERFVPLADRPGALAAERARASLPAGAPLSFDGYYDSARYPHSSFTKLGAFIGGFAKEYRVKTIDANTLELKPTLDWAFGEAESRWHRTGPTSFAKADGLEAIVFDKNRLLFANRPEAAFEQVPWWRSLDLVFSTMLASLLLMLPLVTVWALRPHDRRANRGAHFPILACSSALGGCALLGLYLALIPPVEIAFGVSGPLRAILWLGFATGPFALIGWIWLALYGHRLKRVDRVIMLAACLASTAWYLAGLNLNLVKAWS